MIAETAIVAPGAKIHESVDIGPYSIIDADVEIDEGTWIGPHVVLRGPTKIGKNNKIYQFSSIGEAPQDKKYAGEETRLEIGDSNVIREYCSIQRGTVQDKGVTIIGDNNLFMAYVHVAHDCVIGDHAIFSNAATLAGHVHVGDWAIMSGFTGAHQFCHIGAHSFVGMQAGITKDVPPYFLVAGQPASARSINVEGLKRRGFSPDAVVELKRAYKVICRQGLTVQQAMDKIRPSIAQHPELKVLVEFIEKSPRGILR